MSPTQTNASNHPLNTLKAQGHPNKFIKSFIKHIEAQGSTMPNLHQLDQKKINPTHLNEILVFNRGQFQVPIIGKNINYGWCNDIERPKRQT